MRRRFLAIVRGAQRLSIRAETAFWSGLMGNYEPGTSANRMRTDEGQARSSI